MSGVIEAALPKEMSVDNGNLDKNSAPTQSPTPTGSTPTTPTPGNATFNEQFKLFSKFGDSKSDGKHITLSQSDKWMKQAKIFDNKKITTTDTGIHFKKLKSLKVTLNDYTKFLDDLAKTRKVELDEITMKMTGCGHPGHHGVGLSKTPNAVSRLTDTSKYTGTHKQRFDESGKGKGIAGRQELPDGSGYVTGYRNKDSFEKH